MRRFLYLLGLPILITAVSCRSPEDRRAYEIGHLEIAAETYGSLLPTVSQVDLFAFGESADYKTNIFRLRYSKTDSFAFTNHITLRGKAAEEFAGKWRRLTFGWGYQSMCFEPAFGMRFSSDEKCVFETAVCLHCTGFTVPVGGGSAVTGFNSRTPNFQVFSNSLVQSFEPRKP